ncbi:glycosyltransferase [Cellulomonas fengjieae]|uniref:glycosyltransferase n=1 Tax=Cellulomonas fengjieae TaxID=2819978 RepID=UPI001AAFA69D|nr:glycosyltransferase [Cellulomonas fengjieae]MBO3100536.1 glycosyltransferase family 4 protein [Cellulomonas fengjieae]
MPRPDDAPAAVGTRPLASHVKLYHQARTAHLERATGSPHVTVLYARRRYDFDESTAAGVDARQASDREAARLLAGAPPQVLELTEPAYLPGVRRAALALAAVEVRSLGRRGVRPRVVCYAIANSDPRREWQAHGLRGRAGRALSIGLSRWVHSRVDRIAFGTSAAEDLYGDLYRRTPRRQRRMLVPALPAACTCAQGEPPRPLSLLFLGAFATRKGFVELLEAWPAVSSAVPGATLTLVGMGELAAQARELAAADDRVELVEDPPRPTIHAVLRRSSVLVLPSRPSATWREQVGLPIVEGLQHGCTVVTSEQTGLAEWLLAHGHHVAPSSTGAAGLAAALGAALLRPRDREAVLADLPDRDGRSAAEEWMFGP